MTTREPERGKSFRHGNRSRRVTLVPRSSLLAARRLHGLPVPRMGGVAIASDRDAERASVPGWGVCKSRAGHWSTIRSTAPRLRGQVSHRSRVGPAADVAARPCERRRATGQTHVTLCKALSGPCGPRRTAGCHAFLIRFSTGFAEKRTAVALCFDGTAAHELLRRNDRFAALRARRRSRRLMTRVATQEPREQEEAH